MYSFSAKVIVTKNNDPIAGEIVSAVFKDNPSYGIATGTTDSNGEAILQVTANSNVGTFTVTALGQTKELQLQDVSRTGSVPANFRI